MTYGDLRQEGVAIRGRLTGLEVSVEGVDGIVRDIRSWQTRCKIAVAVRSPKFVAEYCAGTGPAQRLLGETWFPTPGWRRELDEKLNSILRALDVVDRRDLLEHSRTPRLRGNGKVRIQTPGSQPASRSH